MRRDDQVPLLRFWRRPSAHCLPLSRVMQNGMASPNGSRVRRQKHLTPVPSNRAALSPPLLARSFLMACRRNNLGALWKGSHPRCRVRSATRSGPAWRR